MRSTSSTAIRSALIPVESGCQLNAQPALAPEQPQPKLPDVSSLGSTHCLGENETAEEPHRGGVTATALYLWHSVMTALSYVKAPDITLRKSPLQAPLRKVPTACERLNRTAPVTAPNQPGPFGLAVLLAPPTLHCHACSAAARSTWGASPNHKDWLDPLGLRQCFLHTALDLGRIKNFIFPS